MSVFEKALELEKDGTPFVMITFVSGRGHVPQEPGAKALVGEAGLLFGTVGGGKVEARAIEEARAILREGGREPRFVTWHLGKDIGMSCGGEMSFLFEPHPGPSWNVVIYGGGHVAQALVRVLEGVDCHMTCVEAREEWRKRLPERARLKVLDGEAPAALLHTFPANAFHVVVTKGHDFDLPILESIFRHFPEAPYVGAIGSTAKAGRLRRELQERGVSEAFLEKLRCPIGLRLGGNEPVEIAISIAAELLSVRDSLRAR